MRKRAQGLSINVIIIAAIALIILVVLIAIFTGRLGSFSGSLGKISENDCTEKGGTCIAAGNECGVNLVRDFGASCPDTNFPVCCIAS